MWMGKDTQSQESSNSFLKGVITFNIQKTVTNWQQSKMKGK